MRAVSAGEASAEHVALMGKEAAATLVPLGGLRARGSWAQGGERPPAPGAGLADSCPFTTAHALSGRPER